MRDLIYIILGLTTFSGVIYGLFKIETAIYKAINESAKALYFKINSVERDITRLFDESGKSFNLKINSVERDLALHIAVYLERKEQVNLNLRGLEEVIDHVKKRLLDEIKELKAEIKRKSDGV